MITFTPLTRTFYSPGKPFLIFCAQRLYNFWATGIYPDLLPMLPVVFISNHHRITSMVTALEYLTCLAWILPRSYFNLWKFNVLYERDLPLPPHFFNLLALSLVSLHLDHPMERKTILQKQIETHELVRISKIPGPTILKDSFPPVK